MAASAFIAHNELVLHTCAIADYIYHNFTEYMNELKELTNSLSPVINLAAIRKSQKCVTCHETYKD